MYIIITGCGRLGSGVARILAEKNNDVVIVDNDADKRIVGNGFDGLVVQGSPTDQDVLILAGIKKADLLIAATSDDRRNILSVQIATEEFKVPKAIARITDPALATFYSHLGMSTVCPTSSGISDVIAKIHETAVGAPLEGVIDPGITVVLAPREWIGRRMGAIQPASGRRVLGLVSSGKIRQWDPRRIVGDGDSVLLATAGTP